MTPDIKAIREANTGTDCSANIHPATVIALCDEVERLRKDAARLDWLNENGGEAGLSQTPSGWRLQRGLDSTHHQTLHDAIDAAMETKCLNQ